MDRDSITRTGARAPGVERLGPLARRCLTRASALTQSREYTVKAVGTKDEGKPVVGQASSDIPALKPYWGKPAVRNFRGGDGNVGIIRSPVRAIALPDCVCAFCGPEKKVNRVVTYGRSAGQLANHLRTHIVFDKKCADSVPNYGPMTNSWSTSWVGMEHSLRIVKRTLSPTARIDCA